MNKEKLDVLNTAKEYMNNLNSAIIKSSEYLQNGDYFNGTNLIVSITDGLEWIVQLITLRKDIYEEDMEVNKFIDNIKEVVEAFENEDYILIGDLLQYEISPIIEEYNNKTVLILERLNKKNK
ncbi:hypothetical protein ACXAUS_000452 [Clostridium sporogenes]|uniref:hypothetical protein n=1 Tax=Clostridium sporogenes TaxID=1509 RepID=UPI0013D55C25|nr:hypothetical protein [Clostridium sporogenes]MCW6110466.1 hypothetical protein [Clostridium sporogenes]MDU1323234.1 hypothetical protein [Clostridium botulinum]MDU1420292.1 hypothetical protein [Clostridium botulinum]NFP91622.1 hypothetical protein [Clostridium sporogenes]